MADHIIQRNTAGQLQLRAKRGGWTKSKQRLFLEELAETANIAQSAAAVGMSKTSVYDLRKRSAEFDAGVRTALDAGIDLLEMEIHDAALHGLDQPIVYQGKETGRMRVRSAPMMMFLMRAHRPKTYDPAASRTYSHDDAPQSPFVDAEEARARIRKLMDEMDERKREDALEAGE